MSMPFRVWIEPWGWSVDLAPGDELEVVGRGTVGGELEVVREAREASVWAWSGSSVDVYKNGRLLHEG